MTAIVRISETYDLSTQRNKLGLIGIHTPPRALLERHFGPMMRNYRFAKLLGCDVTLVPTAQLPLDPNGIGTGGSQVAPQDAVNPILYKAVSNSHFETLISKIYAGQDVAASSDGSSIVYTGGVCDSNAPTGMTDLNIYYGILAQPKGWRKAFWNTGFHMGHLKPLMYQLIANYGNLRVPTDIGGLRYEPTIPGSNNSPTVDTLDSSGAVIRGKPVVAPALPLWGGLKTNAQISSLIEPIPCNFPTVYVGAVVIPPTTSLGGSRFYFRMRITWTVKLLGLVSYQEHSNFATYNANGAATYWSDYTTINSKMDTTDDSADVSGLEIEKVMESGS